MDTGIIALGRGRPRRTQENVGVDVLAGAFLPPPSEMPPVLHGGAGLLLRAGPDPALCAHPSSLVTTVSSIQPLASFGVSALGQPLTFAVVY